MPWNDEEAAFVRSRYDGWGVVGDAEFKALRDHCEKFYAATVARIIGDLSTESPGKRPNPNTVRDRCRRYVNRNAPSNKASADAASSCPWCEDAKGVDVLLAIVSVDDERLVGAEALAAAGQIRPFGKSMAGEALLLVHPLTADEMQIQRREIFLRCGHCLPRGIAGTWTVERFMVRFGVDFLGFHAWRNSDINFRLIERIALEYPPPPSPRMDLGEYLEKLSPAARERAERVLGKVGQ